MSEPTQIDAVVTSLRIIEYLADAPGYMRISEIAGELGLPRPRVFRHLRTLKDQGYVQQDSDNEKYQLTVKLYHVGQAIADRTDFLSVARRFMPELRDKAGLTVTIGQVEAGGIRVLDMCKYRSAVEITSRPGAFFDLHCSAQGKIALAFGPRHLWENLQGSSLESSTKDTITDLSEIGRELSLVKQRGWSVAPGQLLSGINAMAAPVFDGAGELVGTISCLGSIEDLPEDPPESLVSLLTGTAAEMSAQLGFKKVLTA